jgi:hypothetical protein
MVPQLWRWLTRRGNEPEDKSASVPRTAEEAVDLVKGRWDEHGDRADQDYYHVPAGGNKAGETRRASEASVKAKGKPPKAERPGPV